MNLNEQDIRQALHRIAEQEVSDDMNLWPTIERRLKQAQAAPAAPHRLPRILVTTALALGVLVLMLLTVPPLRTFAQEVVRQIGAVSILFVETTPGELTVIDPDGNEVTVEVYPVDGEDVPEYAAPPIMAMLFEHGATDGISSTTEPMTQALRLSSLELSSIEAASNRVGFPVYAPGSIPEGYELTTRYTLLPPEPEQAGMMGVHTLYMLRGTAEAISRTVELIQHRFSPDQQTQMWMFITENTPVEDVTVRGQPGVWVEGRAGKTHMLLWEQDGFTFMLQSNSLTQAEMLVVAESVGP